MNYLSQTAVLSFYAHLHPEAIDALKPHLPVISEKVRNIYASSLIKTIAKRIGDAEVANELHQTGKTLFDSATEQLSYDDDLFFPSHPKPWYDELIYLGPQPQPWIVFNGDEVALNPQPLPPHELKYYGALLTVLADAVSVDQVSTALRNTGSFLMKQSNSNYEKSLSFSEV